VGRNAAWHAERRAAAGPADPGIAPAGAHGMPAVILLHGWLIDRPQLLVYRRWARRLADHGIAVWMPRLPYHMERSEPGEVSGQRCLSPDLHDSVDAVRQAVAEARLLARWLRRNGAPSVGIWGMSLGAWVAALAATLDGDWDAVALWAPVAAPADVLFESGLVELLRDAVVAGGLSRGDFEDDVVAAMTPSLRDNRVARARVLMVAGIWDQVIAPRSINRIARRWHVDVRWVPHGHISLMASRAPVRDTAAFFAASLRHPRVNV
jgi:pimeloyl-ACP methyl ester carboxylesterase